MGIVWRKKTRTFTCFMKLPPEIRLQIWEAYVHGVATVIEATMVGLKGALLTKHDLDTVPPGRVAKAIRLLPEEKHEFVSRVEDLSLICRESEKVADKFFDKNLIQNDWGAILMSVGKSSDLLLLEAHCVNEFVNSLESFLVCFEFSQIRRVTIRDKGAYVAPPCSCEECEMTKTNGLPGTDKFFHLAQFLAVHFPNLEEFCLPRYGYFEPKSRSAIHTSNIRYFDRNGNPWYEVNEKDWTTERQGFAELKWLQETYVRYAKKNPDFCHKRPERVRFFVLECQEGF